MIKLDNQLQYSRTNAVVIQGDPERCGKNATTIYLSLKVDDCGDTGCQKFNFVLVFPKYFF